MLSTNAEVYKSCSLQYYPYTHSPTFVGTELIILPSMSSSSNGTSSPCKSKMEGEVVSSIPIGCVFNLPIIIVTKREYFSGICNQYLILYITARAIIRI